VEQALHVPGEVGVRADGPLVALEDGRVRNVESDQGHEETNVDMGQLVASEVFPACQYCIHPVQCGKQLLALCVVSILVLGEAAVVDAHVDVFVDPCVKLADLWPQCFRA